MTCILQFLIVVFLQNQACTITTKHQNNRYQKFGNPLIFSIEAVVQNQCNATVGGQMV